VETEIPMNVYCCENSCDNAQVARYPPKPAEDGNAGVGVFGVGPHSDTGFLSLLLQDNVGGLQVCT
jgi:isopenicillin N synthase-like dioxygenase